VTGKSRTTSSREERMMRSTPPAPRAARGRLSSTRTRITVAAGTVLALAVVAAGPGGSTSTNPAAATGTLTIGTSQGLASIHPDKVQTFWEISMRPLMYSALTRYTVAGGTRIQPDLAASWVSSKNLKIYTFRLRPGLRFWSGRPLTAKEVVQTFLRRLRPGGGAAPPTELANVKSVRAANGTTVVFVLKKPSVSLPLNLSTIYIIAPRTLNAKPGPVGSGPYMPSQYVPDDRLTLVPNPRYYGAKAKVGTMRVVNTRENTAAITGLRAGNLDAVWQIPFSDIGNLRNEGGKYKVVGAKYPSTTFLMQVDTSSPPFDKVKARQALSYAIDRQTIVQSIYGGVGTIARTSQPVPQNNEFFAAGLPTYPYDLDRAKALFAEAGVGSRTKLTFWSYNTSTEARLSGELLQNSLSKIGIDLDVQIVDVPTWVDKIYPSGKKYPAYISPNAVPGPAPEGLARWWLGNIVGTNWVNPAFDAAVVAADQTANVAAQKRLYGTAERQFAVDQPAQIISYFAIPVVARSAAKGIWIDPAGFPHFEQAFKT
jgi:peptide/nickel transport system substrate-binding protein